MQIADFDASNNLVELFLSRADELGDKPFLTAKRDGEWRSLSWREAADRVCLLAESLRRLGLEDGDRVVLVSENRPEWALADLAIMAAGCITTPAYTTNTERDHAHVLENSGAKAVIVSDRKLARALMPAVVLTGLAEHVIGIEPVRYLVAPALVAMLVMLPALTIFANAVAIVGAALYSAPALNVTPSAYLLQTMALLSPGDVWQGLCKSVVFAVLITLIGVSTGFSVSDGAEGVGRATTRAVVVSICWIIVVDMVFSFFLNR